MASELAEEIVREMREPAGQEVDLDGYEPRRLLTLAHLEVMFDRFWQEGYREGLHVAGEREVEGRAALASETFREGAVAAFRALEPKLEEVLRVLEQRRGARAGAEELLTVLLAEIEESRIEFADPQRMPF